VSKFILQGQWKSRLLVDDNLNQGRNVMTASSFLDPVFTFSSIFFKRPSTTLKPVKKEPESHLC
jgi:hypothetical protein